MTYTTSFDDDDTPLVEAVIKNAPKIDALDRRFLNIAQTVVNAARKGNKTAKGLAASVLREYREWKQGQSEVPFMQSQYDAWNGRASGWEMLLHSQGVAGDDPYDMILRRRNNTMGYELVGGHKSDLRPQDKEHLGGFGAGGTLTAGKESLPQLRRDRLGRVEIVNAPVKRGERRHG